MLKRIYIEISNICNVQCSFCPVVDRDKKIMAPEDFRKVIAQAAPLADEVCLHLMGEPLAHPQFNEILAICELLKVKVQLTTNGLLIPKKQALILAHSCVRQINFSLQSFKDNFPHKALNGYLDPIIAFTKIAQESRPEMYVNFRLWNIGAESDENEEIFCYLESCYQISINRSVQVGHIKSKRIWNKVYLHFDSRFDWPAMSNQWQGNRGTCHALTSHIGIHADGTVVPCCLDKEAQMPLGNCLSESLESILESKRASDMRQGFLQGQLVEEICQRCTYIKRFSKKSNILSSQEMAF